MQIVSYSHYAGFTRRFLAFLIDRVFIWFVFYAGLGYARGIDMYDIDNIFSIQSLMVELIIMAYFVICETSAWQGTLGKHLLHLRVVSEQYRPLTSSEAASRYLWKYLSAFFAALGFIWAIFDPKKQSWHDKLAHTYVIES